MSVFEKQYGLIEPKTGKKLTVSDVFNNDSDSGDEHDSKSSKKFSQKDEKCTRKQTKLEMQRALQQDPTVYQYDEVYDEMTQKKQETEQAKVNPEKRPKYIQDLIKTAERRKKENERRLERQIQKEREAEGDIYKDKEEFITSSYKQKLEEFKKAEEEEKRMEYIESVMDVSKQQDLGGFYRHLYRETISDPDLGEKKPERKEDTPKNNENAQTVKQEDNLCNIQLEDKNNELVKHQERNYRKRQHSESPGRDENKEKDSSSSSSDSDSSSDSSPSSSSNDEEKDEPKEPEVKQSETKSGSEDGEILELDKKMPEISKLASKPCKAETKTELKDDKLRNGSKNFKQEDKDKRDRNYRSFVYDRDRSRNMSRRDDRNYRDRERVRERDRDRDRNRERDRERERRDYRKMRDREERRSNDSRRKRSKTPDRRKKSRERSRSRKGSDIVKDAKETKEAKSNDHSTNNKAIYDENDNDDDDENKKDVRKLNKEIQKVDEKKEAGMEEKEIKINIWEKRTVGAVFEAAVERYKLRKAARVS